jgi:Uma2 family endonuclease
MNPVTSPDTTVVARQSRPGEPTWEVAEFFPRQGEWTEADYLALDTSRLVELSDGRLEVLPMATVLHQLMVAFLYERLRAFVQTHGGGTVLFAPLPVRLWPGKFREPDVVLLREGRVSDPRGQPEGADLVIEVVSEGDENRHRDLVIKRQEYAAAGVSEYWIVDPKRHCIVVLALEDKSYREAGAYGAGDTATSVLLAGFTIDVDAVFAVADAKK